MVRGAIPQFRDLVCSGRPEIACAYGRIKRILGPVLGRVGRRRRAYVVRIRLVIGEL